MQINFLKRINIEFVTKGIYETIQRDGIERQVITSISQPQSPSTFWGQEESSKKKEMGPNGDKRKQEGMGAQHLGEQICFQRSQEWSTPSNFNMRLH